MACEFRGVRQRTWGKWVAEIREPKKRARLWLGSFSTAQEAALAYDIAARKLYGAAAELNLPPQESLGHDAVPTSSSPSNPNSASPKMHDVEIKQLEFRPTTTSPNVGSSSGTAMHIGITQDYDNDELFLAKSGRALSNSDTRKIFLHEMSSRDGGATTSSSSSQAHAPGQQQRFLPTRSDGEHLKDIEIFLNQIDYNYPTPNSCDDNDGAVSGVSNDSSFSPSLESAAMADHWEDENLGQQFLNLELQSLDSVLNEPLVPENHVELWDTRDIPPRQ